ncbi:anti-sigma factor [Streptomyces sp. ODS05-4]|uniref:anti-sigma factor n=1 Tax=Streptomyces sp. ODS05-4 TaxID=2944939 RepID=UPI00210AEF90|nr:anti-sigma factor [Streptomyces sp. ODS05-4]
MTAAEEPHASVGAYVLHALPPGEEAAFENHLAGCEACRREAQAYASALTWLADAPLPWTGPPVPAPPDVRARVLEQVSRTAQERRGAQAPRPRAPARPLRLALAAALAAAVALGGVAAWQHTAAEDAREREAQAQSAARAQADALADVLSASDAEIFSGSLPGGASVGIVVAQSQDRAAFTAQRLPRLPGGRVYELWYAADADELRPAGLLPGDGGEELRLMDGWVEDAVAVGISVEPAGGSAQPTTDPLAVVPITSSD